jgi:hypothetical protein
MNQINPFTGAVLQSPHVQRQQAAEKDRHLRRMQDQSRNAALTGDRLEHEVENAEAIQPAHDEQQQQQQQQQQQPSQQQQPATQTKPEVASSDGAAPRLDLTA